MLKSSTRAERTFTVVLIVTLLSVPAMFAAERVALLRVGSFHGDEIAPHSGGSWLALVPDSEGASLRRVQVTVTTEVDSIVDVDGEASGKRVEITPPLEAIALLRGLDAFKPGRVPTVLMNEELVRDRPVSVRLGQRSYSFVLHQCVERDSIGGQQQIACQLTLQSGDSRMTLVTYGAYRESGEWVWASEYAPRVIWSGDIDGDGRLDVLLDRSNHYNMDEMALYLSSAAGPGQLLAEVATFLTVGC